MTYVERKGDIFEADDIDVIAHGVNCMGVMGAGFAKEIATRYPWAKKAYVEWCSEEGPQPGSYLCVNDADTHEMVVHLATQNRPGPDAKIRHIAKSVSGFLSGASYANHIAPGSPIRIGMPRIGCGIGGLEWVEVRMILELLGNEYDGELVVFSL